MADGYGIDPNAIADLARRTAQQKLLQQQLDYGRSLQQRPQMQGYGVGGGIGAGLANLANGLVGGWQTKRAGQAELENAKGLAADRSALLNAMMGAGAGQPLTGAPPSPQDAAGGLPGGPSAQASPSQAGGVPPMLARNPPGQDGIAQLGALGAGGGSAAPAPTSGQPPPPAQPSGLEQLAALSQRHQQQGAALLASGDPTLAQAGEALLGRAKQEQQMAFEAQQGQAGRDFQGGQSALARENAKEIANKPQIHANPFGGFAVFDPSTGQAHLIGGGFSPPGARDMNPYPIGSKPSEQVEKLAQSLEQSVDVAHIPSSLQQDVLRLQLGQNLQGALAQAAKSGWTKPLRSLVAGEVQKLVNGVAGSEGELQSIAAKSGIGGAVSDIYNALTGDMSGPQLKAYSDFVTEFANREHGLAQSRLGTYINGQLSGGEAEMLRQIAPKRFEQVRAGALQKLAGLGEISQGGGQPTQKPGSFNLEAPGGGQAAPTHYLVSPDGKMRIAAGPDGKPLPGAKPEATNG